MLPIAVTFLTILPTGMCHFTRAELLPDGFIDGNEEYFTANPSTFKQKSVNSTSSSAPSSGGLEIIFEDIKSLITEDMVYSINASYKFQIDGPDGGSWLVDLENGEGSVVKNPDDSLKASSTLIMNSEDFTKMFKGELNSMEAFMSGRLQIEGSMSKAMKLEKLMKTIQSRSKL